MLQSIVVSTMAFILGAGAASAQPATGGMTDSQKIGQRIVTQHCGVCHFRIQINLTASYGPLLSQANFENGREGELKGVISNGSPNMPGFKYLLSAAEIDSVVDYLKSVSPPGLTARAK